MAIDNVGNSRELYIICMEHMHLVQRNEKCHNDVTIEQVVLRISILI